MPGCLHTKEKTLYQWSGGRQKYGIQWRRRGLACQEKWKTWRYVPPYAINYLNWWRSITCDGRQNYVISVTVKQTLLETFLKSKRKKWAENFDNIFQCLSHAKWIHSFNGILWMNAVQHLGWTFHEFFNRLLSSVIMELKCNTVQFINIPLMLNKSPMSYFNQ